MKKTQKKLPPIYEALTNHKAEIFSLMQSPSQFKDLKIKVEEIINGVEDEVEKNKALTNLNACSNNFNHYSSALFTYLTCIKVI